MTEPAASDGDLVANPTTTPDGGVSDQPPSGTQKQSSPIRSIVELLGTVAVAVGLALLLQAFLVKPYKIPSGSMIPTLQIHQRILVDRLATHPGLGDIVVFHPPVGALEGEDGVCANRSQGLGHTQPCDRAFGGESSDTYVKRVVGLPGDHLRIVGGKVWRNGVRERGSYLQPCPTPSFCSFPALVTVPPGQYFMMGDNRGVSDDSRFWGPIPRSWIIGTAFFTYWPIDRIGSI